MAMSSKLVAMEQLAMVALMILARNAVNSNAEFGIYVDGYIV